MRTLHIYIFFLSISFSGASGQSQKDPAVKTFYELSVGDYPQTVFLTAYRNGMYKGVILTKFYTGKCGGRRFLARLWEDIWGENPRDLIDSAQIDDNIVQKLMADLKQAGIETINDCETDEECKRQQYLDGGSVGFKILTDSVNRYYSFQAIDPYKSDNLEPGKLRRQAQNLVTLINNLLSLESRFRQTTAKLPRGYYCYGGNGNFLVQFQRKKRLKT